MIGTRRRPLAVVASLAFACLAAACSSSVSGSREAGSVGSSGASSAAIAVETSPAYLTVENRAGMPLVDVNVAVQSASGLSFTTSIPRLETGARHDIVLSSLRAHDGTEFSTRWQRAKEVHVTAADVVGKKHELVAPWR